MIREKKEKERKYKLQKSTLEEVTLPRFHRYLKDNMEIVWILYGNNFDNINKTNVLLEIPEPTELIKKN